MNKFYFYKNLTLYFILLYSLLFPFIGNAGVVLPSDLGEMVDMSDYVIYGKVISHEDQHGFLNNFEVINVIKGDLVEGQSILLKEYSSIVGEYDVTVAGDVNFKIGKEYLVFLFQ